MFCPRKSIPISVMIIAIASFLACKDEEGNTPPQSSPTNKQAQASVAPTAKVEVNINVNDDDADESEPVSPSNSGFDLDSLSSANGDNDYSDTDYQSPPTREAASPERLIHYFCKCWKDEDFESMYGALHKSYQQNISLDDFKALYAEDAEYNLGLKDEKIIGQVKDNGSVVEWKVELTFQSKRSKPRTVLAILRKTPDGFRMLESGIVPLDLNNL